MTLAQSQQSCALCNLGATARAMDILLDSGSDNEVRPPPSKKHRQTDGRIINLEDLLQQRCRCLAGNCFIQFQGMERPLLAVREKFQSMDGKDKAVFAKHNVSRSVSSFQPLRTQPFPISVSGNVQIK